MLYPNGDGPLAAPAGLAGGPASAPIAKQGLNAGGGGVPVAIRRQAHRGAEALLSEVID